MTENEQRIAALEKSIATHRKLLTGLICLFGVALTVGATSTVRDMTRLASGTSAFNPIHIHAVVGHGAVDVNPITDTAKIKESN